MLRFCISLATLFVLLLIGKCLITFFFCYGYVAVLCFIVSLVIVFLVLWFLRQSSHTKDVCLDVEQHKWRTIITLIHQAVILTRQSCSEKELISLTETVTALCEARGVASTDATTNPSPSSPPSTNEQRI